MAYNDKESNKLMEDQPYRKVQFYDDVTPSQGPSYHAATFTEGSDSSPDYIQPIPMLRIPTDHFILAIVTTVLCFWPVGIFALWKSREVYRCSARGDMQGAWLASNAARMLSWAALIVGLIIFVIAMVIIILEHDEIEFDD